MNITAKGGDILKKLADDKRKINYKNLLFKTGDPAIYDYDFLKRFGTLYDFLIDLLNENTGITKVAKEQNEMIIKINELRDFIFSKEKSINKEKSIDAIKKVETKTQRRKIISLHRSVTKNAIKLYDKRNIIIDAFINKNILPGNLEEDVYYRDKEPDYEENIAKRKKWRRQNQEGQGLTILTPEQMLSRLPISLAQLKAGKNSENKTAIAFPV